MPLLVGYQLRYHTTVLIAFENQIVFYKVGFGVFYEKHCWLLNLIDSIHLAEASMSLILELKQSFYDFTYLIWVANLYS